MPETTEVKEPIKEPIKEPVKESDLGKTLQLDVDVFEKARAVHRIVRSLHDGECPKCHLLFNSTQVIVLKPTTLRYKPREDERCPNCGFTITREEMNAALKEFGPVMEKNLEIFEEWRKAFHGNQS